MFFLFIVSNKTVSNSLILAVNLDLIDIAVVCAFKTYLGVSYIKWPSYSKISKWNVE